MIPPCQRCLPSRQHRILCTPLTCWESAPQFVARRHCTAATCACEREWDFKVVQCNPSGDLYTFVEGCGAPAALIDSDEHIEWAPTSVCAGRPAKICSLVILPSFASPLQAFVRGLQSASPASGRMAEPR